MPSPDPIVGLSSEQHEDGCDLCEAARFTDPTDAERDHMLGALADAAEGRFGPENEAAIDTNMRQIPEHWHAHARDEAWYQERGQRPLSKYSGVGGDRVERS